MRKRYNNEFIELHNEVLRKHFPHVSEITKNMKTEYEGISRMVMLDRYSQKDFSLKTLQINDLVIAKIKYDPKFPTLGTGFIKSITKNYVEVQVEEEYVGQIDANIKQDQGLIKLPKEYISKPLELFYEQIALRVGSHLSEDEKDDKGWAKKFYNVIKDGDIVPAGRILYGAGSKNNVTYFNCFVLPMPKDSREGISMHRYEVMEIMSRGGGVGTNGSTLRPKDSIAKTVGGNSSGSVSWLNDIASLTDLVQQGGSRRGAQMIMLQVWHPDIIEFIISKMQNPNILNWISQRFENEWIKRFAKDKLRFSPLESLEKQMMEEIVSISKSKDLIERSTTYLKQGGKYEVLNPEFLSGANISVGITHEFMEAVEKDEDFELQFPDLDKLTPEQKEFYDNSWHEIGDVREWSKLGYPVKTYKKIRAKELWDLINFCATYSAEPGVFFIDIANDMTNARAYDQKVVCTNPCGEQPLAPYSVCNLSAINLANMVDKKTGEILYEKLERTISYSVRMQDNIIDKTPYFLKMNEKQAKGERRIGMGVMGLHDLLIWSGKKYGTKEANKLIDDLFKRIAVAAYKTSARLAKEKSPFLLQKNINKLLDTGFIKTLPKDVIDEIKECGGLRNSHLLTIAPTGSTGTMMGVSTGLEPYFAFKYFRSGRLGKFMEVESKIVSEYRKIHKLHKDEKLPSTFISAMELSPESHADTQCIIQRWVDSSISKTVNAPAGYSVKSVEKIYNRLYKNGAKGGTVYVDGSRNSQVLSLSDGSENDGEKEVEEIALSTGNIKVIQEIREDNANVPGSKQDKNIGVDVGDICPICKEGTVEDLGGCVTCTLCNSQLKCGI